MCTKRYLLIVLEVCVIIVTFSMCSSVFKHHKTIGDIAFNECRDKSNSTVFILEDGIYVPYLVVSNDYHGNTLLLREMVLPEPKRMNEYTSYYEESEIDCYLNESFIKKLSEIDPYIQTSDLAVTQKGALGNAGRENITIPRRVFLLSAAELGFNEIIAGSEEGSMLSFFSDDNNRIAYDVMNQKSGWWLRTPNTYYDSCVYAVGPDGKLGDGNASDYNGIRPAFCVASSTPIENNLHIVQSKKVYCIKSH